MDLHIPFWVLKAGDDSHLTRPRIFKMNFWEVWGSRRSNNNCGTVLPSRGDSLANTHNPWMTGTTGMCAVVFPATLSFHLTHLKTQSVSRCSQHRVPCLRSAVSCCLSYVCCSFHYMLNINYFCRKPFLFMHIFQRNHTKHIAKGSLDGLRLFGDDLQAHRGQLETEYSSV